jgi:hypothetical protein
MKSVLKTRFRSPALIYDIEIDELIQHALTFERELRLPRWMGCSPDARGSREPCLAKSRCWIWDARTARSRSCSNRWAWKSTPSIIRYRLARRTLRTDSVFRNPLSSQEPFRRPGTARGPDAVLFAQHGHRFSLRTKRRIFRSRTARAGGPHRLGDSRPDGYGRSGSYSVGRPTG